MTFALDPLYRTNPECLVALFDLRDPESWQRAREARAVWGKNRTDIYPMGLDHVLLVFRPGGGRRVAS